MPHKTIIRSELRYASEKLLLTIREEKMLIIFERKVLRIIFVVLMTVKIGKEDATLNFANSLEIKTPYFFLKRTEGDELITL